MSTPASIANFAVDTEGREVPIRYAAADLVNKLAPEGYVWQKRTYMDDAKDRFFADYDKNFAARCVWVAEAQARFDKSTPEQIEQEKILFNRIPKRPETPVHDPQGEWKEQNRGFRVYDGKSTIPEPYYIAVRVA